MRGAAYSMVNDHHHRLISTHAPHARRGDPKNNVLQHHDNFYSRASCEARPFQCCHTNLLGTISTHAPHARRGTKRQKHIRTFLRFLLTRLMRGAAALLISMVIAETISTHAPHARRGVPSEYSIITDINFYSRASCEARPFR